MFLFEMEGAGVRAARLRDMAAFVLHRLGDAGETIWTRAEIERYVEVGARELAESCRMIWDQLYLENLPAGFSHTARFEARYLTFTYGLGGYTSQDEGELADSQGLIEMDEQRMAFHTSPGDLPYLEDVGAPTTIPALADLPDTLTDIERTVWDKRKIEATNHHRVSRHDSRYQITEGEVFAYIWQKEGPSTLRKIRVPAEVAWTYEHAGSWGIVRDIGDVSSQDADGTWGVPRRIPAWHPMGWSEGWGTPRRFYRDERNVRVEHYRQPHLENMRESDLPDQYFKYLAHYAQTKALRRNGPGQDYKLAQLYDEKWKRCVQRVIGRVERQRKEVWHRLGGTGQPPIGPPRPRLPWQYGQPTR